MAEEELEIEAEWMDQPAEAEAEFEMDKDAQSMRFRFSIEPLDIIAIAALLVAVIVALGSFTVGNGLDSTTASLITGLLGASAVSAYTGHKSKDTEE